MNGPELRLTPADPKKMDPPTQGIIEREGKGKGQREREREGQGEGRRERDREGQGEGRRERNRRYRAREGKREGAEQTHVSFDGHHAMDNNNNNTKNTRKNCIQSIHAASKRIHHQASTRLF